MGYDVLFTGSISSGFNVFGSGTEEFQETATKHLEPGSYPMQRHEIGVCTGDTVGNIVEFGYLSTIPGDGSLQVSPRSRFSSDGLIGVFAERSKVRTTGDIGENCHSLHQCHAGSLMSDPSLAEERGDAALGGEPADR